MEAKDKKRKLFKISIKRIICFFSCIIILLYGFIFYNHYFIQESTSTIQTSADLIEEKPYKISEATLINLDEIISKNVGQNRKEEYSIEETELEYITKYKNNNSLPVGTIQVLQEGREGKQQITKKTIYENEEIIAEEQINSKITKASVDKIVEVGTNKYVSISKAKVGDKVFITSDRASIMVEPSEDAQKIATLSNGKELKVLEVQKDWYKISGAGTIGYIKTESTTTRNSIKNNDDSNNNILVGKLSFDMQLNKPSGLSLEQFKKVLTDSKDKNKVFENNAEYFYYIEKQYNINGIFVAAVGIHESAWGTSSIAGNKNNLFGYGAYDSNPYNGAYSFSNYSESIDLLARVFVKYYLNPKGTSIYGNETATGSYYNGATLSGVNTRYATDKNWANGVYNHMKYLYNKL